jgi:two-component sensor histidine kinase
MVKDKTALRWIKKLLAAPVFEDEDKTRMAGLLNIILWATLAATVSVGVGMLSAVPEPALALAVDSILLPLWLGARFLMHRGRVQLATWLLSSALGVFFIGVTFGFGGVRISSFSSYVVVILIAGLLLGGRAGITFAGLGAVAGLGILGAELGGVLPPSPIIVTPAFTWVTVTAGFAMAAALLHLATRSINDALGRARRNASALAESHRKLRTAHVLLEEHAVELSKANEQLRREIDGRKRVEGQLKASLKEKEVLLQEIHHRVKNNMQVISSLLNLQSGYVEDPQALEVFQESQHRVRSMALIHEKLYQSENLAQIDFGEYIRSLVTSLSRSYSARAGDITLDIRADDVPLGIDTAVPCGLILNELVSNALKYAFPDGRAGQVRVELTADDDRRVTLTVGDDGVGFPEGLDFRGTTSLGLQLVNTLVDQLEGSIELNNGRGTEFKITFSVPNQTVRESIDDEE